MKQLNNRGIALLTALMTTVIMFVIILGVMYLVQRSIKGSAAHKTYRSVVEASYGGADLVSKEIIPRLFNNVSTSIIRIDLGAIQPTFASSDCLHNKLDNPPASWGSSGASCNTAIDPKKNPDVSFELAGLNGESFTVNAKIVDTTPGAPYATVGSQLVGGGVAESSAGGTLKLDHYVYRIEVSGESRVRPDQKATISVLYEY